MLGDKISRGDSFCEEGVALSFFCVLSRFICSYSFVYPPLPKTESVYAKSFPFCYITSLFSTKFA